MNQIFPVFIPHAGCPYRCIFCDQAAITGASLDVRPDSEKIRGLRMVLAQFIRRYHFQEKEIAFYGGTFTAMPVAAQEFWFELAGSVMDRKTGLRISTRPDCVSAETLERCRDYGVTTIELGIQSFEDDVLGQSGRLYSGAIADAACHRVLDMGFQLGVQLMPGLPGDSPERFRDGITKVLDIRPDFVRIYPTIVLAGTELEALYRAGKYIPWSLDEAVYVCAEASERLKSNRLTIAKIGLHSDIPQGSIVAGPYHRAFGELVRACSMFNTLEKAYHPGMALIVSGRDLSLLRGASGIYHDRFREQHPELPIYIDRNRPKDNYSIVEESKITNRTLARFQLE